MILVIDNYDSFVETLARYVREAGQETKVIRNDALGVDDALAMAPDGVVLSPGPGRPAESGILMELIARASAIPMLGVCLGHQAMAEVYGGETVLSPEPVHGRASKIEHDGSALFTGVPSTFPAGRYHSLLGRWSDTAPLRTTAWLADGTPMALAHNTHPHFGVQFHPESLLTPDGRQIVDNFLSVCRSGDEPHVVGKW